MKTYNVNLDEDAVEALDRFLDAAGFSRSGFINTLVVKTVEAMKLKEIPDYSKMTLSQMYKMVGGLGKMMEGKDPQK